MNIASQNRQFFITLVISFTVHLFALTLLFTIPQPDSPAGYKRVKVRLGTGHGRKAPDMSNAQKYASFEPASGGVSQPDVIGNSDVTAPEIAAKTVTEPQKDSATPETQNNLEKAKPEAGEVAAEKNDKPTNVKSRPALIKPVVKQTAKPAPQSATPPAANLDQDSGFDYENSTLIGNSVAPTAQKLTTYEQMLPLWLEKFKQYPEAAKAEHASGNAEIFIKIDRKGKILLSKIISGTGNNLLDAAILKMISEADPVLPVPDEYHPEKKTFAYKIAIEFKEPDDQQN